ncbi:iron ABC transporter permease [Shouchella clausii]|nr:iron ABC transporter permease [Shouchella clausii]
MKRLGGTLSRRLTPAKATARALKVIVFLLLAVLITGIIGLSVGSQWVSPFEVIAYFLGGAEQHAFVIGALRFPRMAVAFLAGAALGIAGLILQEVVRNPLASPDVIGITSGASAAAVGFITLTNGTISIRYLPLAAIFGAGIAACLIYGLAWKRGASTMRLVLTGIGVAAVMNATTTLFLIISPIQAASQAYTWLVGSVYGRTLSDAAVMAPWAVLLGAGVLFCSRAIQVHQLGDSVAIGLGARVQLQRLVFVILSVGLAGTAVAFAGAIGFVGLVAPHLARLLVGRPFVALVVASALIGGWLVFFADVVARTAFLPLDIPVGVFISGIGAPFFIYLLFRARH